MGVVVRRYIDFLIIIITYFYSTCIIFFWRQHPYFLVHFKNVFLFLYNCISYKTPSSDLNGIYVRALTYICTKNLTGCYN